MFVWADGKVNPCDYDYKSLLSKWNAKANVKNMEFKDWYLRNQHLNSQRKILSHAKMSQLNLRIRLETIVKYIYNKKKQKN